MVISTTDKPVRNSDSENASDTTKDPSHNNQDAQAVEDWGDYGDDEVWVMAQKLLKSLPQTADQKVPHEGDKIPPESPGILTEEGGELNNTEACTGVNHSVPLAKGNDQQVVLDKNFADMLLPGKVYFVHFPSVYCYDRNGIIFRIGEGPLYHQVTTIAPNPPPPQVPFDIGGITYCFDEYGTLWYLMGEFWLPETTYAALSDALSVIVQCIEENNLHLTADPIYSPSSSDPGVSTSTGSDIYDTSMDIPEYDGLRALSENPDQAEVDSWMDEMKRYRTMQVKEGIRLDPVCCPVCGKTQRRPQALRDHLYFHFSIKPHRCDFGCPMMFETEANKNRHLETCQMMRGNH